FSLDFMPRMPETSSMDALRSMSAIAGYKSVIIAAFYLGKVFLPLFKPIKILVLGAGVAGMQAIATAKKLGADVIAMDNRIEVKAEVKQLGAKFVSLSDVEGNRQQENILNCLKDVDIVIASAKIPGK